MSDRKYEFSTVAADFQNMRGLSEIRKTVEASSDQIDALFEKASENHAQRKDGHGLVMALFNEGDDGFVRRRQNRLKRVTGVGFDFESERIYETDSDVAPGEVPYVPDLDEVIDVLPFRCMAWSSYSHGLRQWDDEGEGKKLKWSEKHPRYHLIFPFSRPVDTVEEYKMIWGHLRDYLTEQIDSEDFVDSGANDVTRILYTPRPKAPEAEVVPWIDNRWGLPLLDPDDLPGGTSLGELLEEKREREAERERERKERLQKLQGGQMRGPSDDQQYSYARAAVDNWIDKIRNATSGSRHDTLVKAGASIGGMIKSDMISEFEARGDLIDAGKDTLPAERARTREVEDAVDWGIRKSDPFDVSQLASDNTSRLDDQPEFDEIAQDFGAGFVGFADSVGDDPNEDQSDDGSDGEDRGASEKSPDEEPLPTFDSASDVEIGQYLHDYISPEIKNGKHVPLVYDEGGIWGYNPDEGVWKEKADRDLRRQVMKWDGAPYGQNGSLKISSRKADSVVSVLKDLPEGDWGPGFFRDSPPGVQFQNVGLYHRDGDIVEIEKSPAARSRHLLDYEYDPNEKYPRWEAFLNDIFQDDDEQDRKEKIQFLQEFVGAAIFGIAHRYEKWLLLFGEGANGKSKFLDVISAVLPEEMRSSINPSQLGNEYYRAMLRGKRLNVATEISSDTIVSSETLKAVVSAETITGREAYGKAFEFSPEIGFCFACNEKPSVVDVSKGFWRRPVVIDFTHDFSNDPEKDPQIAEKIIKEELPGVVAWAVEGARRVIENDGYSIPAASKEAKSAWRSDSNPIISWAEKRVKSSDNPTRTKQLYDDFLEYADEYGYKTMSYQKFTRRFKKLEYEHVKPRNISHYKATIDYSESDTTTKIPENLQVDGDSELLGL